ncbi:CDP-glycerol glycerophosphotransferase family protein [Oceanobacillus sp. FSL K6-2867]|uniref:CDP-glycerol glycerophosphotransferase family protein n=1 Tax=Oceanobacillus sp. FSL K6-2867 TaxID=2954748 RepID=UPI0030DA4F88
MNTYVKNYWSLYLDFLYDFQKLNYKGFSLSFICHFPSLIRKNTELWKGLYDEKFSDQLKNEVRDQKEIQEVFNNYILSHKKKQLVKVKQGKVVVNYDTILRFPEKTFNDYFDRSKTMIVMAGSKNNKKRSGSVYVNSTLFNLPVNYLSNYKIDTKKDIVRLQNQAKSMFKSYKNHHLYKDGNFQTLFLKKIAEIVNCIEQSIHFYDEVLVSCLLVASTHSYISRILLLVAAERGIPSICIQHGILANEFGFIPKIATVDAVYGNYEMGWYKRLGVSKKSIAITGHPRFDQAFQPSTVKRSRLYKQLGLDKNKKTIMIVVRGNRDIAKWRILINTISKRINLNIVIKDYPIKTPHDLTKEFPFVHSSQDYNLYDILPNVDVIVSYPSTVCLEAMLVNKPLFVLNKKLPSYTGYYDSLDEIVQKDPKQLGELIVRFFNDSNWRAYVHEKREKFLQNAYPDSSMSGERLKKLINSLTR